MRYEVLSSDTKGCTSEVDHITTGFMHHGEPDLFIKVLKSEFGERLVDVRVTETRVMYEYLLTRYFVEVKDLIDLGDMLRAHPTWVLACRDRGFYAVPDMRIVFKDDLGVSL